MTRGGQVAAPRSHPSYTNGPLSNTRGRSDGAPVYTFRIPEPGTYRVRVGENPAPDAQMRLGPSVVRGRLSGLLLMVGGLIVGGVLLAAGGGRAGGRRRAPPPMAPAGNSEALAAAGAWLGASASVTRPHSAAPTRPGPHADPPASTPPGMDREWPLLAIPVRLCASPELSGP
jgi:hypothetical protein